jgi:exopolyphosphatase / guanosine-5'-triphosphate,3'-diphosphate pyrophosphatase
METLFRLLTEDEMQEAEVLGKAMRFAAMFSIHDPDEAGRLGWNLRKRILELSLTPRGHDLFGEVARARFMALALALKATPLVMDLDR